MAVHVKAAGSRCPRLSHSAHWFAVSLCLRADDFDPAKLATLKLWGHIFQKGWQAGSLLGVAAVAPGLQAYDILVKDGTFNVLTGTQGAAYGALAGLALTGALSRPASADQCSRCGMLPAPEQQRPMAPSSSTHGVEACPYETVQAGAQRAAGSLCKVCTPLLATLGAEQSTPAGAGVAAPAPAPAHAPAPGPAPAGGGHQVWWAASSSCRWTGRASPTACTASTTTRASNGPTCSQG